MSPFSQRLPLSAAAAAMLLGATADQVHAAGISAAALARTLAGAGGSSWGSLLAAGTKTVTSCADDNSADTLRAAIIGAASGDTIDLTALPAANANCSSGVITLTLGAISTTKSLVLSGPGPGALAISAPASGDRVFMLSDAASQLEIDDLTISGGRALVAGGCIYSKGSVTLAHSTLTDCQVHYGGGAFAAGGGVFASTVTLKEGSLVEGNSATFLHNNKYEGVGGGITGVNAVVCSDSTVRGNYANQSGGGILSATYASITRCTIEGNTARATGGGITMNTSSTQSSVIASTISGNSAARGGGIYTQAAVYIVGSTIAFNNSVNGDAAGIWTNAYLTLKTSIVARNISAGSTHADLQTSAMVDGYFNLVESNSPVGPDIITVSANPKLLPLADNGGPTRTHALEASSPAIDAGNNPLVALTDQRGPGFLREQPAGKPDIGAFEFRGDGIFLGGFE